MLASREMKLCFQSQPGSLWSRKRPCVPAPSWRPALEIFIQQQADPTSERPSGLHLETSDFPFRDVRLHLQPCSTLRKICARYQETLHGAPSTCTILSSRRMYLNDHRQALEKPAPHHCPPAPQGPTGPWRHSSVCLSSLLLGQLLPVPEALRVSPRLETLY